MGFADRAEKNLMSSKSSCKDFKPNIFNKTKCQNCFRTREAHTLDSSDSEKPKKVLLCGYLYIAPGIDFTNPSHKGRKWQRRCFILYENGELCYALDDNPATIPQGNINMYDCVDINNTDGLTGQLFSLGITTSEEIIYIRAETKEEKESWLEILSEYPELNREAARQNKRKKAVYPMTKEDLEDTNNSQNRESNEVIKQPLTRTESDIDRLRNDTPMKDISRSISCPPGKIDADLGMSFSEEIQKVKDENHNRSWSDGYGKTNIEKDVEKWLEKRERPNSLRSIPSIDLEGFSSSEIDTDDDQCFKNESYRSESSRQSSLSSPSPREQKKNDDISAVARMKKRSSQGGKLTNLSRSASARHVRAEHEDTGSKLTRSCSAKNVPKKEKVTTTAVRPSDLHRNNNNVNDYAQSSRVKRRSNRKGSGSGIGSPRTDSPNRASPVRDSPVRASPVRDSPVRDSPVRDSPTRDSPVSDAGSRRDTPPQERQRRNSLKLIEQGVVDANIRISTEDLDRIDASSKSMFKFNKSMLDGESPSPSRRTIERRRHAQERKGRHTLDGSLHIQLHGEPKEEPKLKRSNSDPNLSEADDMLKRKEIAMTFPGLFHLKKGWLIKQGESEQDWSKHWFVLCDNKLTYYKDQQAEENCSLSGVIELANCVEACSTTVSRNYGFEIRTPNYSIILAAMTSGIKNNWVQAVNKAIATARSEAGTSPSIPPEEAMDGKSQNIKIVDNEGETIEMSRPPLQKFVVDNGNVEETIAPVSETQEMSQPPSRKFIPDVDFMLGVSSSPKQEDEADTLDEVSQIESDQDKERTIPEVSKPAQPEDSTKIPDLSKKSRERKNKRRARSKTDDRMEKDIQKSMKAVKEGGILRSKSSSSINVGQRTSKDSIKKVKIITGEYLSPDTTLQEDRARLDTQPEELVMLKDSEVSHASLDTSIVDLLETEVDSLKGQLTSTRVDLENSNQDNVELNAKIERLIREHKDEMSEVMTEQSAYEAQLEKLRQKKNNLEEEKQRMVDELNQKEVNKSNLEKLNEANTLHNQEIETLQIRCDVLVTELEKSNDELTKNRSTVKLEREKVTNMIEKLNDRIDGLEEEVGDKKVLLLEAESQATIKAKQVRELETLLRQSKSGQLINDLMAELTDTRSRLEESETVVIQNDERFEKRYLRLKDKLRAENNALKNQLQLAEEQLAMTDADMLPLVTHNEVVGNLKNELGLNESAMLSLQQKCTDLQNELAQIVLRTQGELGSVQSNESAIRLEESLEETKGQLKFLKEMLENEKTSGANLSIELENERKSKADLLKELEELSQKLKQHEQTIKQTEASHENKTEQIVQKVESELLNSEPVENVELKNMRVQLNESECEIKKLMEQFVEKQKEKETFVEKLNSKDNEIQELQKLCEKSLADFELERKSKELFKTQIVSLQKELEGHLTKSEEQSVEFLAELQRKDMETRVEYEEMQIKWNDMKESADVNAKKMAELELQLLQKTEVTQVLEEQGKSKARDTKKLRTELKDAQQSFDELEWKHIQTKEEFKKMEKSQAEQILLMGSRIKDLTTKLAAAERKVRDASRKIALEQKSKFSKGRSGSRELEIKLKELETQLEDVEMELEMQENDTASLEGKMKKVSDSLKKNQREQIELISSGGEASEEPESSVQDFNGSVSSQSFKSGLVGFKLDESEEKLKEVTRKLVDLTARELDNRKSYQVRCASERALKQEVVDLRSRLASVSEELNQVRANSITIITDVECLLKDVHVHVSVTYSKLLQLDTNQLVACGADPAILTPPFDSTNIKVDYISIVTTMLTSVLSALESSHNTVNKLQKQLNDKSYIIPKLSPLILNGQSLDYTSDSSFKSCLSSTPITPDLPEVSKQQVLETFAQQMSSEVLAETNREFAEHNANWQEYVQMQLCLKEVDNVNAHLLRLKSWLEQELVGNNCIDKPSSSISSDINDLLSSRTSIEAEAALVRSPPQLKTNSFNGVKHRQTKRLSHRQKGMKFYQRKETVGRSDLVSSPKIDLFANSVAHHAVKEGEMTYFMACTNHKAVQIDYKNAEIRKKVCSAHQKFTSLNSDLQEMVSSYKTSRLKLLGRLMAEEVYLRQNGNTNGKNLGEEDLSLDSNRIVDRQFEVLNTGSLSISLQDVSPVVSSILECICLQDARHQAMNHLYQGMVLAEVQQVLQSIQSKYQTQIETENGSCRKLLKKQLNSAQKRYHQIEEHVNREMDLASDELKQQFYLALAEIDCSYRNVGYVGLSDETYIGIQHILEVLVYQAVIKGVAFYLNSNITTMLPPLVEKEEQKCEENGIDENWLENSEAAVQVSSIQEFAEQLAERAIIQAESIYIARQVEADHEKIQIDRLAGVMESIAAEHAQNITSVRQRYEKMSKVQRDLHTNEMSELQSNYTKARNEVGALSKELDSLNKQQEMAECDTADKRQGLQLELENLKQELITKQQMLQCKVREQCRQQELLDYLKTCFHEQMVRLEKCILREKHRLKLKQWQQESEKLARTFNQKGNTDGGILDWETSTNEAPLEGELVAQQKFHRDLLEEQTSQYRKELEELKNKREKELEEEAAATAKAISALRRVHNEELERERLSVSEMMSDDVESVMKRHREVINRMEKEWRILSEKYSCQCRENVNLQRTVKNLKQMMEDLETKKDEITKQNLEVTTQLEIDVELLRREMEKGDVCFDENDMIRQLQIQLRIKEIELKCSLDDQQKSKLSIEATKKENKDLQENNKQLQNERQLSNQRIDALEFQVGSLKAEGGRIRTSGEPEGSVDCEEVFESPVSSPGQFDAKYNPWFPPENERHPLDSSSSTQSDSSRLSSSKIEHV